MKKKGFTLIELLVVVAIIAVLVAILLPSLQGARDYAKQISCSSNMRQVGMGLRLYMDEWKEMFPPTGWGTSSWWWNGYSMLERMTEYKYITYEVRICPCRQTSVYCENFSAIADDARFQSRKITQDPYYFVVFGEHGIGNSGAYCFDWDTYPNRIRFVDDPLVDLYGGLSIDHRGGSNFLFFDNHVTWFKSGSDIGYQGTLSPNLLRYWSASGN
jgi:prepilin-type N-terminal cleavage/methylation domain-containing protein/prepilin-type processing-associated H-X9-DG protein